MEVSLRGLSECQRSQTAPHTIAVSARLKAGQCQPAAWKSRKSVTAPRCTRSIRLPNAPPTISANASCSPDRVVRQNQNAKATVIAAVMTMTGQALDAVPKSPKDTPRLKLSVRSKNGSNSNGCASCKRDRAQAFVPRSSAGTARNAVAPNSLFIPAPHGVHGVNPG